MTPEDTPEGVPVSHRERVYTGNIWAVDKDTFELEGQTLVRDYICHMGAVAVVAVNERDEILVITQYRHAVGHRMVELPAGLLDIAGEPPAAAAARELLEETGYRASDWAVLVDLCTTPGSSSEALRIFVARGVEFAAHDVAALDGEERGIERHWVALADAVEAVLGGKWQNPTAVAGVLALAAGGATRPADAPWPLRDVEEATGRVFRR